MFFLMFYLIGINAADLFTLRHDAVVGDRLEYVRAKTHKRYSVRIEPEASALLERYRGKSRLVRACEGRRDHKGFLKEMNRALKSIGDVSWTFTSPDSAWEPPRPVMHVRPYVVGLSSYHARHSWATIAYDVGVPSDVIAQALGHSFGNRVTMSYVRVDDGKVDRANRMVIDLLLGK